MLKAKWFSLKTDQTHKGFLSALQNTPYQDENGWGFGVVSRGTKSAVVRFIERIPFSEEIIDPYGQKTTVAGSRYQTAICRFFVAKADKPACYVVEVLSPPRSLRNLISSLASATGNLAAGEVEIPMQQVASQILQGSVTGKIRRIKLSQFVISPYTQAKLDIVSTKDAAADFASAFDISKVAIEKIRIENPFGPNPHCIEFSRTGSVACDEDYFDQLEAVVLNLLSSTTSA
jgi:hypothetical protein